MRVMVNSSIYVMQSQRTLKGLDFPGECVRHKYARCPIACFGSVCIEIRLSPWIVSGVKMFLYFGSCEFCSARRVVHD